SLDQKLAVVQGLGVNNISVWVLGGGNHWFAKPSAGTTYQAEASGNTLTGRARVIAGDACPGGHRAGYLGTGSSLTITNVTVPAAGTYQVVIAYTDGSSTGRQVQISVNGGTARKVSVTPTGSFGTPGNITVPLVLAAGPNSITFGNPTS